MISQSLVNKLPLDKLQINNDKVNQQQLELESDKNIRSGIRFNENPSIFTRYPNANGEFNLSFRGDGENINIKESGGYFDGMPKSPKMQELHNIHEMNFKLNAEKDYLQTQVNILKQRFEEDRVRHERQIEEERNNFKRKENDFKNFIEELKRRHKEELFSYEESNKTIVNTLNEEIKRIRNEIGIEVQNEKERMNLLHQNEIESRENLLKKNFEAQKKLMEDQIENLKKQLEKQTEMNKIANKVENSSQQIEDILHKFYREKEIMLENERNYILTREKNLLEKEEKIKESLNSLETEKEKINQLRKDFEIRELEKKKEIQEEKNRIEKEITKLQELQNSLKTIEYNSKEKYDREKYEMFHKQNELKKEHDEIKRDFNQRLRELENEKKILEEEKKFFEKYKEESIKSSEIKKFSFEERKNKYYEEEKEIKSRIKILQEKEYFLKEKFEEFERIRTDIYDEGKKLEKDRTELINAARRIEEGINQLDENKRLFEHEKSDFLRKFHECENEKAHLQKEKIKIEQIKAELNLRIQSIDLMRMQYVTSNLSSENNYGIVSNTNNELKNASLVNFNKTLTKFNDQTLKINNLTQVGKNGRLNELNFIQSKSSLGKSFNSDEYMQTIRMKMNDKINYCNNHQSDKYEMTDFNNFFIKEKEYLKKSNEDFLKYTKRDSEKLSAYQPNLNNNVILSSENIPNNNFSQPSKILSKENESYNLNKFNHYNNQMINLESKDICVGKNIEVNTSKIENKKNEYQSDFIKHSNKYNDITDESIKLNNQKIIDNPPSNIDFHNKGIKIFT